jgi:L-ascorbate metabolism protein UlaG (beta-lactamase superfamily)
MMAGGTLAVGAGLWLGLSGSRRARFLRQLFADVPREPRQAPVKPVFAEWDSNRITLAWLGHATVLINFYGLRILTDPVLFNHVGVGFGLGTFGPKRHVRCALTPKELPPIDLLLLSHAHLDHLDFASLNALKGNPHVVTAAETGELLDGVPCKAPKELRWGDAALIHTSRGDARIEAFEVKHWGRRWPRGKERGYNGYVLEREGRRVLFAGDTAFTTSFAALKSRGPFAAALMPIAAYDPWIQSHCTPEEAVEMAFAAGAERIAPIHHATFKLSDEPMAEPIERLEQALSTEPERIGWRRVGETMVPG